MTLDRETLERAGWRVTTEHAASSHGIPVVVAPDGAAVGDADIVNLNADGSLCEELGAGRLMCGAELRDTLGAEALLEGMTEDE